MTERRRPRRPSSKPVIWASILLFATLFVLLAFRFAAEQSASAAAGDVHVRKVIKRRVVTTIVPSPGENTVSAETGGSSSYSSTPEPVVTSSS